MHLVILPGISLKTFPGIPLRFAAEIPSETPPGIPSAISPGIFLDIFQKCITPTPPQEFLQIFKGFIKVSPRCFFFQELHKDTTRNFYRDFFKIFFGYCSRKSSYNKDEHSHNDSIDDRLKIPWRFFSVQTSETSF